MIKMAKGIYGKIFKKLPKPLKKDQEVFKADPKRRKFSKFDKNEKHELFKRVPSVFISEGP